MTLNRKLASVIVPTSQNYGFLGGSLIKNLPANANAGDPGSIPGLERAPGEGNGKPLQYCCLGNSMNRGARQATYSPWGHKDPPTEHA